MDNNQLNNATNRPEPPTITEPSSVTEPSNVTESTNTTKLSNTTEPTVIHKIPPKKKRTSLIISIIIIALIAISGIFATFIVIKNQPDNIAAEAFTNLINAKQVAITGTLNANYNTSSTNPVSGLSVTFNSLTADINQSSNISLSLKLAENDKTIDLDLSDVFLKDGILYIKVNGVSQLFNEYLSGQLNESIKQTYKNNLSSSSRYYKTCDSLTNYQERLNCYDEAKKAIYEDPAFNQTIDTLMKETNTFFDDTLKQIDNQWFEFSIKDILRNSLARQYISSYLQNNLLKTQDCATQMLNNLQQYSNEFTNLYSANRFISLEPADDSFYKVSLDANNLASFIYNAGKTKPFTDYIKCYNNYADISSTGYFDDYDLYNQVYSEYEIDENESLFSHYADNIRYALVGLPDIYVRFDGFFTHHLVELKLSETTSTHTITSSIRFSYPSNHTIMAPENSHPIMDLVENAVNQATEIYQKSTNTILDS